MSAEHIIQTDGLARWYGQVAGLTDLTVDIPRGITGMLGPNGAGKSTLMRLLMGLIRPSSGSLTILGLNPMRDAHVFRRVGFCSEDDALFDDMTPRTMVSFLGRASGIPRSELGDRVTEALKTTGIHYAEDRRCGTFSKGMRQRTRLAACLVHDPEVVLLDEPMTGLDPVGRKAVIDLVKELGRQGKSVLFSSHILHEVEAVAEHVILISRGMLLANGSLAHIKECMSDYSFTMRVVCDDARKLARRMLQSEHVNAVELPREDMVQLSTSSSRALVEELTGVLLELDLEPREIDCPGEDLESIFQRLLT